MGSLRVDRFLCLVILAMLLTGPAARGAILNSLRGFSDAQEGWSGGLSGSYSASGGNTEETSFKAAASVQWQSGAEQFRLLGNGKRTSTAGTETARALTGHLRHNHRFNDHLSSLSFVQVQENPFQQLKSRTLVGVGGRWDILNRDGSELALGAAHMWEGERLEGGDGRVDQQRLSAFFSVVWPLREGLELDSLAFYQPAWSDFQDWRLFWQTSLDVELTGTLSLFTGLQVEHDSRPAAGVEKTDWETSTGFSLGF